MVLKCYLDLQLLALLLELPREPSALHTCNVHVLLFMHKLEKLKQTCNGVGEEADTGDEANGSWECKNNKWPIADI